MTTSKNDCVADYGGGSVEWIFRCLSVFFKTFTKLAFSFTNVLFSTPFTFSHICWFSCLVSSLLVKSVLRSAMVNVWAGDPGGGNYFRKYLWVRMCRWDPGTLEPLAYTRATSAEFCYPILG